MDKKPTKWQMFKIKARMGKPFASVHDMTGYTRTVIKFKDKYIEVAEGPDDAVEFGWSRNPDMFPDLNLNDIWVASPK